MIKDDYNVGELIEKLKEYPEDLPVWFIFQHSNGIMTLFDLINIGCFQLGGDDYIHFILKSSNIYDENKKSRKYIDELKSLRIENRELVSRISNLTSFIISKGYDINDFNDFLVEGWKKEDGS